MNAVYMQAALIADVVVVVVVMVAARILWSWIKPIWRQIAWDYLLVPHDSGEYTLSTGFSRSNHV